MRKLFLGLLLTFATAAKAGQGAEYVNAYFAAWLEAHNFTQFERRIDGVYFPSKKVLLDGEIYEANEQKAGKSYSVESRISVTFSNGRKLDDFVAGVGDKVNEAFFDSLQNFCLTTLHPIYAELFNHEDPHVRKATWNIRGVPRRVFLSEWGQRGSKLPEVTQAQVEKVLADEIQRADLSSELHWVKLVVLIEGGKPKRLVVTIDGVDQAKLSQRLAAYNWPNTGVFSMAKLFFVIGAV